MISDGKKDEFKGNLVIKDVGCGSKTGYILFSKLSSLTLANGQIYSFGDGTQG
jgi:hypothetical protein